jgi:hypothetical protein
LGITIIRRALNRYAAGDAALSRRLCGRAAFLAWAEKMNENIGIGDNAVATGGAERQRATARRRTVPRHRNISMVGKSFGV